MDLFPTRLASGVLGITWEHCKHDGITFSKIVFLFSFFVFVQAENAPFCLGVFLGTLYPILQVMESVLTCERFKAVSWIDTEPSSSML